MNKSLMGVAVLLLVGSTSAVADTGGDPPIVTIYDENFVEVEAVSVAEGRSLLLYAVAIGDTPFCYYWCVDGELAGTDWPFTHVFEETGVCLVRVEVVDANGLSGCDTVVVTVTGDPVASEPTTWGGVKALFRP